MRSGPSAEKLALKQRRREEAEAAAAAKGRAEAAAFSAERASLRPEEVVIAPASFSVDAERESGDMQWLFDVDTARDAKKARLAKRTAAPTRGAASENAFAALAEDAPAARPAAPEAVMPPTFLAFAPPSFSLAPPAPAPGDFSEI